MTNQQKPSEIIKNIIPKADTSIPIQDRLLGALSYVNIFFLISLLRKNSLFVQLHARQGFVLFAIWLLTNIAVSGIPVYFRWFTAIASNLAIALFSLLGIFMGIMGQYWKMPYGIGNWVEKWKM